MAKGYWKVLQSTSTTASIITVQNRQTQPHVLTLWEYSLKWIKRPALKSSKDVVDKAKALLNTAAGHRNPRHSWWATSERSEYRQPSSLPGGETSPGWEACAPATPCCLPHIPGLSSAPSFFPQERRKQRRVFSSTGINTWKAQEAQLRWIMELIHLTKLKGNVGK